METVIKFEVSQLQINAMYNFIRGDFQLVCDARLLMN